MITGFNTDIEFEGVTYHVQTEDKGLARPIIMSLIYNKGTILASKRSPYDDLLGDGFDENTLAERLQKQHKLICAAIQAGRIEDLKRMSAKDGAGVRTVAVVEETPKTKAKARKRELAGVAIAEPAVDLSDFEISIPKPDVSVAPIPSVADGPIVDVVSVIDDPALLPESAVAIVSDLAGKERPSNNKLAIEFLSDERFKAGETKLITVMVCRGSSRKIVQDAEVMVKIIGSAFRPLIFHSNTDKNGLANVTLKFPKFQSGRAAFLVRAMSDGEEVELRRPITQA